MARRVLSWEPSYVDYCTAINIGKVSLFTHAHFVMFRETGNCGQTLLVYVSDIKLFYYYCFLSIYICVFRPPINRTYGVKKPLPPQETRCTAAFLEISTMQPARRRPRPEVQHPDSQRWQTTLSSDLERVAKQLEGSEAYDTTKRMAKVKATKMANQVTSISFGNERVSAQDGATSCIFCPCRHFAAP